MYGNYRRVYLGILLSGLRFASGISIDMQLNLDSRDHAHF
jgi:hypothetical protein